MWPFKKRLPKYLTNQCPDYVEPSPWSLDMQIKKYAEMKRIQDICKDIDKAYNFYNSPKETPLIKPVADYLKELEKEL